MIEERQLERPAHRQRISFVLAKIEQPGQRQAGEGGEDEENKEGASGGALFQA